MPPDLKSAFADLELVERALALALTVPAHPPGAGVDTHNYLLDPERLEQMKVEQKAAWRALGPAFRELRALNSTGRGDLHRICSAARDEQGRLDRAVPDWCLFLDSWAGTTVHFTRRLELIELLIQARARALDAMRRMPEPGAIVRSGYVRPESLGPPGVLTRPEWEELSDTQQEILMVLKRERLTRARLAKRLKKAEPTVKKCIEELGRLGFTKSVPGGGYIVLESPRGMPGQTDGDSEPAKAAGK